MSTGLLLFRAVIHRTLATCSPDPLPGLRRRWNHAAGDTARIHSPSMVWT